MATDDATLENRPTKDETRGFGQDNAPLTTLVDAIGIQQQTVRDLTLNLERAIRQLQDAKGDGGHHNGQLAELLALQLRHGANPLTRAALDQIRDYSELRSHLGGAQDVGVTVQARIRAILPPRVRVGDEITILVENAGVPTSVAFAAPDGGTVRDAQIERVAGGDQRGTTPPVQVIRVRVPGGAITGPVTVVTDQGEPTSVKPLFIDTSRPRGSAIRP
jgi:hypothetical protein